MYICIYIYIYMFPPGPLLAGLCPGRDGQDALRGDRCTKINNSKNDMMNSNILIVLMRMIIAITMLMIIGFGNSIRTTENKMRSKENAAYKSNRAEMEKGLDGVKLALKVLNE